MGAWPHSHRRNAARDVGIGLHTPTIPANVRQAENRAVRHRQGKLKAPESSHTVGIVRAVSKQAPKQQAKPNAMPKNHGRVRQVVHQCNKCAHAGLELGESIRIHAKASMRVWIAPIILHERLALRAVQPLDKRRVDHRKLVQAGTRLRG